jgi:hypothetical protein
MDRDAVPDIGELYLPGKYVFNCTLWAEGLDEPISRKLTLSVIDDRDSYVQQSTLPWSNIGLTRTEYRSSKYGFETANDRKAITEEEERRAKEREESQKKREIDLDKLASDLNPKIQDILEDFLSAYEIADTRVFWDGKRYWHTKNDYDDYYCAVRLKSEGTEVYLELDRGHRYDFSPGRRIDEKQEAAFSRLREVLSEQTSLPIDRPKRKV